MIIRNQQELLSHGNVKGREIALDIVNNAMKKIDASKLTKKRINMEGDLLKIDSTVYDLSRVDNIYVLGAGKGVLQIAEALEEILGDRIKEGLVIEKELDGMKKGLERIEKFEKIRVLQGAHPTPNEVNVKGTKEILEIAKNAKEEDLVFFCVQGGCTCLTTLPADGLSLEDIRKTNDLLLESGANIEAVNAVRTPITELSEGRIAKYLHPAEVINLVVDDYIWSYGSKWDSLGWGPSVPVSLSEHNDFEVAVSTLKKYGIWEKVPDAVRTHLKKPDPNLNAQDVEDFEEMGIRYSSFVLATPEDGVEAAKKGAEKMGINSLILSSAIEGEAREVGIVLAGIAKEIERTGRPLEPPCVIISAGEKTVSLLGEHGEGGRNQECVLGASLKIDGSKDIVILSVGTDGTDGPTRIAGGIVDGFTMERIKKKRIDIHKNLKRHNSSYVLRKTNDAILFNEPGNNVCDLSLIVVTN